MVKAKGKRKKVLVKEKISEVISQETGEVLNVLKTEVTKVTTSDAFIQIYLDDMQGVLNIKNYSEFQVLAQLWQKSKFDTNEVILVKQVKEEIAEEIGTSLQNVNNTISQLKKKELLINPARGIYYLNPKYFFKGYIQNRPHVVKTIMRYLISDNKEEESNPKESKELEGQKKLDLK